ncbi:hypothetical protein MtrunA17_Chr6g0472951 [Medicago truncatula]|uniref:Transmembrane protein n=1 Tax=Medicago truncatula TaxID=3880 RepID=A0A396HGT1_MEDTR|nr:hypothetical protein MtrunA17_Chr6g0472951 [Medicago truncatula]
MLLCYEISPLLLGNVALRMSNLQVIVLSVQLLFVSGLASPCRLGRSDT